MEVSSEEKVRLLREVVTEMALIGYRLDKLLVGFKLYDEYKGTTDILQYEEVLDVYKNAILAMEEQMQHYHRLFSYIKTMVEKGG